jgi:periplasmic divalent cation tolerance protein
MTSDILVGFTTVPDRAAAEQIVDRLVQEGLIACANILADVSSIYRWRSRIEREAEVLIIMKTTEAQAAHVIERVRGLHPYEVPEVLFLPVSIGNDGYMQWVRENSMPPQDSKS